MQKYLQLSISSVQFCSSSGYLRRSIIQAAVVVILGKKERSLLTCLAPIFPWSHFVERRNWISTELILCLVLVGYHVCCLLVLLSQGGYPSLVVVHSLPSTRVFIAACKAQLTGQGTWGSCFHTIKIMRALGSSHLYKLSSSWKADQMN